MRKPYCPTDFGYGRPAELAVMRWLSRCGISVTGAATAADPYGPDVTMGRGRISTERFVEVERRRTGWKSGDWPWPTIHIPARRVHKPNLLETALAVVRADCGMALVIRGRILAAVAERCRPETLPVVGDAGYVIPSTLAAGVFDLAGIDCPFTGVANDI